ncbi:glycosyltransferase [Erwinia tracheiphila]|uniref:Glycosyltransferase n=2 Tax=Erwinia tracheiphila TaxID=65700 RepID=A0A345CZM8_9GAMM|nr:glycosyltransferase [Erwinia tracheiphila]
MIIDGLPGGGAEKVVLTLASGLIDCGHHVSLFSLRDVCDYPIPDGLHYLVIKDDCKKPWRKLTELSRRAALLNQAIIETEQASGHFDLVVSHLHKTDRIVRRCDALFSAKTWFCLHGVFSASYLTQRKGFSLWLKKAKTKKVYENRNVLGVSQYVIDDLKQAFRVHPAREVVIYNPFDFDAVRQQSLKPCKMAGEDYLVHVGRFHQTKRHDRLLRAYAKSGLTAPLVLIGQGSDDIKERLKKLAIELAISERVIFKGFTSNPYPWIRNARMLVVSSDSEGFGNVLVEALICHTPVVSTRCPGGPTTILTGELARGLAEMNDDSLAATMKEIWENPPDITQLNLEPYSVDTICQQYLELNNKLKHFTDLSDRKITL